MTSGNKICIDLYLIYSQSLAQIKKSPSQSDKPEITLSNVLIHYERVVFADTIFEESTILNFIFTAFDFGVNLKEVFNTSVGGQWWQRGFWLPMA